MALTELLPIYMTFSDGGTDTVALRNVNKRHDERLTVCCRLVITGMMRK